MRLRQTRGELTTVTTIKRNSPAAATTTTNPHVHVQKPAHPPPATTPIIPQLPAQQQARSLQHPQLASMMINTRSPLNSMRNFMNVLRRIQRPSTRSSRDDQQAINAQQPAQLSVLPRGPSEFREVRIPRRIVPLLYFPCCSR